MERTVSDLLNQQNKKEIALQIPQVKKRKMPVVDVLFPSHALVLASQGYGKMVVQADPSVQFGTFGRPLVSSQSIATIEYSDITGLWTATAIETTNTCVPTMEVNVPNIPLPSFKPIVDSSIVLEPFRVDTNFSPFVGPMGQIVPSVKMPPAVLPPGTTGGASGIDKTPVLITQHPYLTSAFVYTTFGGIVVKDGLCAIVDYDGTAVTSVITLLDVTNPSAPVLLSQTTLASTGFTTSVKLAGNYMYVLKGSPPSIKIYDISDPTAPSLKSTTNTVYATIQGDFALFTVGTSIYIATMEFNSTTPYVKVYDVTNAATPAGVVGSVTGFAGSVIDSDFSAFCDGLFYTLGSADIGIFDLTTPATPSYIGPIGSNRYGQMSAIHNKLLVADTGGYLYIFNTTNPASPTQTSATQADPSGLIALLADGHFAYINTCSGTQNRLLVYDIKTPATPTLVGQCNISNSSCPQYGIAVEGNHVFMRNIGEMTYGLDAPILEIAGV